MIKVSYVVSISLSHPKSTHCAENSVQKQFSGQLYETLIQNSKNKSLNMVQVVESAEKLKNVKMGSDLMWFYQDTGYNLVISTVTWLKPVKYPGNVYPGALNLVNNPVMW